MKITSTLTALIAAVLVISATQTATAQLPGLKQFDPFNKNSRVRERLRTLDNSRRVEGRNLANGYKQAHGVKNPFRQRPSRRVIVPTQSQFVYSIVNRTSKTVSFHLPGGKHTLRPGEPRRYKFVGYKGDARIYVVNSGSRYQLRPGAHKFWTMKDGRIGFDMNYRRASTSKSSGRRSSSSSNRRHRR